MYMYIYIYHLRDSVHKTGRTRILPTCLGQLGSSFVSHSGWAPLLDVLQEPFQ